MIGMIRMIQIDRLLLARFDNWHDSRRAPMHALRAWRRRATVRRRSVVQSSRDHRAVCMLCVVPRAPRRRPVDTSERGRKRFGRTCKHFLGARKETASPKKLLGKVARASYTCPIRIEQQVAAKRERSCTNTRVYVHALVHMSKHATRERTWEPVEGTRVVSSSVFPEHSVTETTADLFTDCSGAALSLLSPFFRLFASFSLRAGNQVCGRSEGTMHRDAASWPIKGERTYKFSRLMSFRARARREKRKGGSWRRRRVKRLIAARATSIPRHLPRHQPYGGRGERTPPSRYGFPRNARPSRKSAPAGLSLLAFREITCSARLGVRRGGPRCPSPRLSNSTSSRVHRSEPLSVERDPPHALLRAREHPLSALFSCGGGGGDRPSRSRLQSGHSPSRTIAPEVVWPVGHGELRETSPRAYSRQTPLVDWSRRGAARCLLPTWASTFRTCSCKVRGYSAAACKSAGRSNGAKCAVSRGSRIAIESTMTKPSNVNVAWRVDRSIAGEPTVESDRMRITAVTCNDDHIRSLV